MIDTQTIDWPSCVTELGTRHEALITYLAGSTARLEAGRLIVTINSPAAAAWIHHRFRPVIQAVVHQVAGISVPVTITV